MRPLLLALLLLTATAACAADFNGTTSVGSVAGQSYSGVATYCVWFLADSLGEGGIAYLFSIGPSTGNVLFRVGTSNEIRFYANSGGTSQARSNTSAFSTSVWTLACARRADSDGGPRIYLGTASSGMAEVSYAARTDATPDSGTETFYLGNDSSNARTFDGALQDFRWYNTALSLPQCEQIRRGFEPAPGNLVHYWPVAGDPPSGADTKGGATLSLSAVGARDGAPLVRPWGWWAFLQWRRWAR